MANPFVHVELNTADRDKARNFYGQLFHWQLEEMADNANSDHSYTIIKVGGGTGGGIMKQIPHGPAGWIPYVLVDDLRATADKAKALGGKIMKDVTEVPGMGSFVIIQDPAGSVMGLWKSS